MSATAPAVPAVAGQFVRRPRLFWALQVAGWIGYFAFNYLIALAHGKPGGYLTVVGASAAMGFVATVGLRYVLRALWTLPATTFFAAALVPVLLTAMAMGLAYVFSLIEWCDRIWENCRPESVLGYIAYMSSFTWVVLSWAGLYWGIKNYQHMQAQTQAALKATAMAHQAQLRMLRYQLNPHFLFNTLNAISTLVLDGDNVTANRMVTSLSAFLRHSLDADPMQRVTLKQELDALNLYLGIEKVRFPDRLTLRSSIEDEAYGALMPSLLLQPLIENAIKYAVAKRIEGGTIEINARRDGDMLEIQIRDDGPGCPHFTGGDLPPGNGVGLRNARDRMSVLYGGQQAFIARNRDPRGVEIMLRLPFEHAVSGTD